MVNGINGSNGAGNVFNNGFNNIKKTAQNAETAKIGFVPMTGGADAIKRQDLDNINPYAGIVDISAKQPVEGVEIARAAAPEFGGFQGNFTINNTKEASYDLADMNFALQARTPEGARKYAQEHTNAPAVERNMAGLTDLFEQFDLLLS